VVNKIKNPYVAGLRFADIKKLYMIISSTDSGFNNSPSVSERKDLA
jgi:hypothetical protein